MLLPSILEGLVYKVQRTLNIELVCLAIREAQDYIIDTAIEEDYKASKKVRCRLDNMPCPKLPSKLEQLGLIAHIISTIRAKEKSKSKA